MNEKPPDSDGGWSDGSWKDMVISLIGLLIFIVLTSLVFPGFWKSVLDVLHHALDCGVPGCF